MRTFKANAGVLAFTALGILAWCHRADAQAVAEQPHFTKQAFGPNGPLTAPPQAGDTISFVLGYNYGNVPAGSVNIVDTLSSGLTYSPLSLSASGWNTSPAVPYSLGNQETYTNAAPGPAKSFTVNVPVSFVAAEASTGGDGFYPIPVGGNVYEIYHHQGYGSARIACVNALTFVSCWPPRLLNDVSAADLRTTPQIVKTVVNGPRIYYPSASHDTGSNKTYFGIGCFDTGLGTPCDPPFILLPGSPFLNGKYEANGLAAGTLPLYRVIAGVVADSNNPNRLFMYAVDKVYCVDVTTPGSPTGCNPWTPPTLIGGSSTFDDILDIMVGDDVATSTPKKIYVHFGTTGGKATVACLSAFDSTRCGTPWPATDAQATLPSTQARYGILSAALDTGRMINAVCLHPYGNGPAGDTIFCFGATGLPAAMPAAFNTLMGTRETIGTFHAPNSGKVFYGHFRDPPGITCFDFDTAQACNPFNPGWTSTLTVSPYEDYGYSVDPAAPERCLLGLGNTGFIWRFARDGSFDKNGCTQTIRQTFDIKSLYCAGPPKEVAWQKVTIIGRPLELTSGTITLTGSSGSVSIQVGSADTYAIPAGLGASTSVTLDFVPTYSGPPTAGYQLQVTFASGDDPQICYQAVVKCGPVSNKATLTLKDQTLEAGVNLGNATGAECDPGILKVCKVAGTGITVGTPFNFTISTSTSHGALSVPAGPAPGGTCMVGPSYPVGTQVAVSEIATPGNTVSGISVAPQSQLVSKNLAAGGIMVTIGRGVTEVTYIDQHTGFIEICKKGDVRGSFSFTVSPGNLGPFSVPAGACSPAIEVAAGMVTIHEQTPGYDIVACSTIPVPAQQACNMPVGSQNSVVTVAAGDISTMTIAFITNRPKRTPKQ